MTFNERVEEKFHEFDDVMELIKDDGKKILIADVLMEYCHIHVQLQDINEAIIEDGTTVTGSSGQPMRNPDLQTQHALRSEKTTLMGKLIKLLPDGEVKDALASFAGI